MDPDSIEAILRGDIERGEIAPGSVLRQEQLAARFGVSRQPIRQVLQRLHISGLLEHRSDRSLAVKSMSLKQAAELIDLRIVLETSALYRSLPSLDAGTLRKARHMTDEMLHAQDEMEIEQLDVEFHRLLYGRCGNERILALIEDLRREGRAIYRQQLASTPDRDRFHSEHEAILTACMEKDAIGAARALEFHLQAAASVANRAGLAR